MPDGNLDRFKFESSIPVCRFAGWRRTICLTTCFASDALSATGCASDVSCRLGHAGPRRGTGVAANPIGRRRCPTPGTGSGHQRRGHPSAEGSPPRGCGTGAGVGCRSRRRRAGSGLVATPTVTPTLAIQPYWHLRAAAPDRGGQRVLALPPRNPDVGWGAIRRPARRPVPRPPRSLHGVGPGALRHPMERLYTVVGIAAFAPFGGVHIRP